MAGQRIEVTLSADSSQLISGINQAIAALRSLNSAGGAAGGGLGNLNGRLNITANISAATANALSSVTAAMNAAASAFNNGAANAGANTAALNSMVNTMNTLRASMDANTAAAQRNAGANNNHRNSIDGSMASMLKMSIVGTLVYSSISAITNAVEGSIGALAKYHSNMEQSNIAFETLLGNAGAAKLFFQDIQKMAADTPFELPQLVDASKKMLAFGFAAKDVLPTLTAVGNAASGLGSGQEGIQRITLAFGQMKAKGKASGDELLQLMQAGIPATQILQQKLGLTAGQMQNIAGASIDADKAIKALVEGINEKFPNMMAKQSDTAQGMLSTVKDNTMMLGAALTNNIFLKFKDIIGGLRDFTNAASDAMTKGNFSDFIKNLVPAETYTKIVKISTAFSETFETAKALVANFYNSSKPFLLSFGDLFLTILPTILSLANELLKLGNTVMPAVNGAFKIAAAVLVVIKENAGAAIGALAGFVIATRIAGWVTAIATAWGAVRRAIVLVMALNAFLSFAMGAASAAGAVGKLRVAILALGMALKTVSRGNIFTVLFALGLAVVGEKIFDMIDKLNKGKEPTDAKTPEELALEQEQKDAQAKADEEARKALNEHKGTPPMDLGSTNDQFERATKAAEAQISLLNTQINAAKASIEQDILNIQKKPGIEGRSSPSPEESTKLMELQRDLQAAEVERFTKEKAIIESILSPADTDSKHKDEITKKSTDAGDKARAATVELDKLNNSLYDTAKAAGLLTTSVVSAGVNYDELAAKAQASGRTWLNRDDGIKRYDDNRLDPDKVVCGQLVVKSWEGAGIDKIVQGQGKQWYSKDDASNVDNIVEVAKALGAYHTAGSGYTPKAGDAIIVGADQYHTALVNSQGGVINASGHEKGVYESNTPWQQQYPNASGFVSLADMVGSAGSSSSRMMTADEFGKQYAKNANLLTPAVEEWVNAVKNLLTKSREIEALTAESKGDVTAKGYKEVQDKYQPYVDAFKAGGAEFKPQLDQTNKLIDIGRAKVDLDQVTKDMEKIKSVYDLEVTKINQKFPDLKQNLILQGDTNKEYQSNRQGLADKALSAAKVTGDQNAITGAETTLLQIKQDAATFAQAQLEKVKAEMQAKIDAINARTDLVDFEKTDLVKQVKVDYAPLFNEKAAAAVAAAKEIGDNEMIAKVKALKKELSEVPDYYTEIKDAARNALATGLENFFESGIFECKNLGEAFRNLAIDVLKSIQKINSQRLTNSLMKSWGLQDEAPKEGAATGGFVKGAHIQHFSEGGMLSGEGTGTSDSILAKLSNGEFIMKASTVRRVGVRFMHALNQGVINPSLLPRFATGGAVGKNSSQGLSPLSALSGSGGSNLGVKIINVTDPNEVGKYMNTREGERVMFNHIKKNAGTYRQILNIKG